MYSPATSAYLASTDQPRGAGIPRQLGERGVILLRLELCPKLSILLHCLAFTLVTLEPRFLCHRKAKTVDSGGSDASGNYGAGCC